MPWQQSWLNRLKLIVFWAIHTVPFLALFTGSSARSLTLAFVLYWFKMFLITGGYHRYFAHRSYQTSRLFQFMLGFLGTACLQRGPLWWAAWHRHHHRFSDQPQDPHSPRHGFYESHLGWIVDNRNNATNLNLVRDLAKFPELRWLNRWHAIAPLLLTFLCYAIDGWRGVVIGMGWSAVASWHATFTINSLAHLWGKRRYVTSDTSRNNGFLALLTMGEGWHNNHHHYMSSARQGFFWWEIDLTYYVLWLLERCRLISCLRHPPLHILNYNHLKT